MERPSISTEAVFVLNEITGTEYRPTKPDHAHLNKVFSARFHMAAACCERRQAWSWGSPTQLQPKYYQTDLVAAVV